MNLVYVFRKWFLQKTIRKFVNIRIFYRYLSNKNIFTYTTHNPSKYIFQYFRRAAIFPTRRRHVTIGRFYNYWNPIICGTSNATYSPYKFDPSRSTLHEMETMGNISPSLWSMLKLEIFKLSWCEILISWNQNGIFFSRVFHAVW